MREIFAKHKRRSAAIELDSCCPYVEGSEAEDGSCLASVADKLSGLHPDAQIMFKSAQLKYQADPERKGEEIEIVSGKRNSKRQAELYDDFKRANVGLPPIYGGGNRANPPGMSYHEFGFAIDVVRSIDEPGISRALTSSGWYRKYEGEAWHFEATSAKSYALATNRINSISAGSAAYRNIVEDFFQALKNFLDMQKKYDAEIEIINKTKKNLDEKKLDLINKKEIIDEIRSNLVRKEAEHTNLEDEISRLISDLNNMKFSSCPNGKSYNECDHLDLKRLYDDSVRVKKNRISSLQAKSRTLQGEIRKEKKIFSQMKSNFMKSENNYRKELSELKERQAQNGQLLSAIENEKHSIDKKRREKEAALEKIIEATARPL